jgi:hypothetical protein
MKNPSAAKATIKITPIAIPAFPPPDSPWDPAAFTVPVVVLLGTLELDVGDAVWDELDGLDVVDVIKLAGISCVELISFRIATSVVSQTIGIPSP